MVTKRPHGAPAELYPRIAAEFYENSTDAQKLKRQQAVGKIQREAKTRATIDEVMRDPELTLQEKIAARRKLESQARIAEKTDAASAQLEAGRAETKQRAQRDLSAAFSEDPGAAGMPQEVNYHPGVRFSADLTMSPQEMQRTARMGRTFSTEEEIAALKAHVPRQLGSQYPAQLVPQALADAYSAEKDARLEAFDQRAVDEAKSDFASRSKLHTAEQRERANIARRRGQTAPRVNPNDFRFNSGGRMQRGSEVFDVSPGMGERDAQPAPYGGMAPDDFVANPGLRRVQPTRPTALPTVNPIGRRRPAASVFDLDHDH